MDINILCECGAEIMKIDYFDDEKTFCFTQFRYSPIKYSFRRRLKFLFTGEVYFNEIIINPTDAKLLADYINKNINYVEKKKEESRGKRLV
jgi:hypothetical protein